MRGSLIGLMRHAGWFLRSIAGVVLVAFTSLIVTPAVLAVEQMVAQAEMQATASAKSNMGQMLVKVRDELRVLADRSDVLDRKPTHEQRKAAKDALKVLRQELRALDQEVRADFAANQKLITDKKLSAVIQERQDAAVAQYQAEYSALDQSLVAIEGKPDEVGARTLAVTAFDRLAKQKLERSHQDFDPNDLPNKSLKPDRKRLPKTDPIAWIEQGFVSNPQILIASTAPFDYSKLAGAGNPAYLAATTEVVLTDAIRAKAEELGKDPVKIYNWVRNNVIWQPTWGAIQDAELTLSAQRGNAFDVASLTIALFRASGIPARYVHGTIDVPEDKFRSWMGGWQNLDPAIDFASAGGIPIQPITSGGRITKVRMEHIWVEVAIDYIPSRGAKNLSADSWLALDSSFKQVALLQGIDPVTISGINPQSIVNDFLAAGTVNEQESWMTGFGSNVLQDAQEQARAPVEDHIGNHLQDATVGDVLGGVRIVSISSITLPSGMPNKVIAVGARYSTLPTNLQQQITFAFGKDALGEPQNPTTYPWALLNNRMLTLSFRPATQADEDAFRALLPEGEIADISEVPTSIPAYLIKVVPELKVEGDVVMVGAPMLLGQEIEFVFDPSFAGRFTLPRSYKVIAGSYLVVAVVSGSLGKNSSDAAAGRIERTTATLLNRNPDELAALSRDDILGSMFFSGMISYLAHVDSLGKLMGRSQAAYFELAAGQGSYGYEPRVDSVFGVPRRLDEGGAVMNAPLIQITGSDDPDATKRPQFAIQVGVLSSALEHAIPEQVLVSDETPGEGVSAVKALRKAAAAGQRIYRITSGNQGAVLPLIHHNETTMREIRKALAGGKEVFVHTDPISVPGWSGAGYIILDTNTGDGGYRIGGGFNGLAEKMRDASTITAAGAMGFVDGKTGHLMGQDIWFSDTLKYLKALGKASATLGAAALIYGLVTYLEDEKLSADQKLGKASVELLFFGITAYVTSAIVASSLILPIVVALSILVAITMTLYLLFIQSLYFVSVGRRHVEELV